MKITYKEVSIILGILVAILAIFSYWLTLQHETAADASLHLDLLPDFEIGQFSKSIQTILQTGFRLF